MKIDRLRKPTNEDAGLVRMEMSCADFEKLQEILRCASHAKSCEWYAHSVYVRQAITFALDGDEAVKAKH